MRSGSIGSSEPRSVWAIFECEFIACSMKRGPKPRSISQNPGRASLAKARIRYRFRQPDVDVEPERCRNLVLEERSNTPMLRIDTAQQLTLIETQRDAVVPLTCSRRPRWSLSGQHDCQSIEVADKSAIDRHVERKEPSLMRQQLANGDVFLLLLRKLGPVTRDCRRRSPATRESVRGRASSPPGPWYSSER
jgi:hypothetical protein